MTIRTTILLAAGALLATRAVAEGTGDAQQTPPPSQSWYQKDAQRARELGQRGESAAKKGASSAGKELNAGGQAINSRVAGTRKLSGEIADASADRITVRKSDGTSLDLRVTGSTKVTVDGKKAAARSLRPGDEVRASYAESGGAATATKLDVKRAARPSSSPAR